MPALTLTPGADNTETIQKALRTASDGSVVQLPPGNWQVRTLKIPDSVCLSGAGNEKTSLVALELVTFWIQLTGKGCALQEVTTDGNELARFNIYVDETSTDSQVQISGVLSKNSRSRRAQGADNEGGDCLYVRNCTSLRVSNSIFTSAGRNTVSLTGAVIDFRFHQCTFGPQYKAYLVDLEPNAGGHWQRGEFNDCTFTSEKSNVPGAILGLLARHGPSGDVTVCKCTFDGVWIRVGGHIEGLIIENCIFDLEKPLRGGGDLARYPKKPGQERGDVIYLWGPASFYGAFATDKPILKRPRFANNRLPKKDGKLIEFCYLVPTEDELLAKAQEFTVCKLAAANIQVAEETCRRIADRLLEETLVMGKLDGSEAAAVAFVTQLGVVAVEDELVRCSHGGMLKNAQDLVQRVKKIGGSIDARSHNPEPWQYCIAKFENGKYKYSCTNALHQAIFCGHLDVVKMLVQEGASLHRKDGNGCNAITVAKDYGRSEIADFLVAALPCAHRTSQL